MLFQELAEMRFTCRVIAHFSFPQHRKWILLESKRSRLFVPLTASPPRFVSVEELMETAKGVTNMALAHEIMVNSAFQVKPAELPEGRWECWLKTVTICWLSHFLISNFLLCPHPSIQSGAQSEGDHAQSILGLFGSSDEGGSTDVWTCHQTAGWDQRGEVEGVIQQMTAWGLTSAASFWPYVWCCSCLCSVAFNRPVNPCSPRRCCLSCCRATAVCAPVSRRSWTCLWSSSRQRTERWTSAGCPSSSLGWWARCAPPAGTRTSIS